MSASLYKRELKATLASLQESSLALNEWRKVAENRHLLLIAIDGAVSAFASKILMTKSLLGVKVRDMPLEVAEASTHTSNAAASLIMGKITTVAYFVSELCHEAASLQLTLDSTLRLALEARDLTRPTSDLVIADDLTKELEDIAATMVDPDDTATDFDNEDIEPNTASTDDPVSVTGPPQVLGSSSHAKGPENDTHGDSDTSTGASEKSVVIHTAPETSYALELFRK